MVEGNLALYLPTAACLPPFLWKICEAVSHILISQTLQMQFLYNKMVGA
jgi:hypothetical protein